MLVWVAVTILDPICLPEMTLTGRLWWTTKINKQTQWGGKLDRIFERFDKLESTMDETDRRFENRDRPIVPEPDPPYDQYDMDDWDRPSRRRHGPGDRGYRSRHEGPPVRDRSRDFRHRRQGAGYDLPGSYPSRGDQYQRLRAKRPPAPTSQASCWDPPAARQHPPHFGGYDSLPQL